MIHPIPSGTRDVLPDETRELRVITDALRSVFERYGYGEVYTPALEYESVLAQAGRPAGGETPSGAAVRSSAAQATAVRSSVAQAAAARPADARPAYRVFDESGAVLALRSDMTVPIARVAATRYAHAEPPLRFCYLAHCYRGVRPQRGQPRELLQAGVELIGSPAPQGTAEALTVLCACLDAVGLQDYRIGLGDASLFGALMESVGVRALDREALLPTLAERNFVALEERLSHLSIPAGARELLLDVPQRRGGFEVISSASGPVSDAVAGLRSVYELLDPAVAGRVIFDLGLVRSIGYYTGAIFEVYDPALGAPIGGGGRYDELLGRFGRSLPAAGFALGVERLHIALAGEERGTGALLR